MAHITSNTDKTYPCINCGSKNANIIREGPTPEATKLKCSDCGFLYGASDSINLENKGALPDGPPPIQEPVQEEAARSADRVSEHPIERRDRQDSGADTVLPRTPAFIFISKDRTRSELCTKRDLRKKTLAWEHEGMKYDVFQLLPKKVNAKIEVV